MDKKDLIAVRNAEPGDVNFILSTWLRGLRYGNDWFLSIDADVYFKEYNKVAVAILSKPGVIVRVACLKDDPEVILGYAVTEGDKIHWTHVKKAWRNIGVAKGLIPGDITVTTHLTNLGKKILSNYPNVRFNPFL